MTLAWNIEDWGPAVAIAAAGFVLSRKFGGELPGRPPKSLIGSAASLLPGGTVGGVDDYTAIYLGQKVDARKRFGEHPPPTPNNKLLPITPRSYATGTILMYWANEVNRLCGYRGGGSLGSFAGQLAAATRRVSPFEMTDHPGPAEFGYEGIISIDSAKAITRAWNRRRDDAWRGHQLGFNFDAVASQLDAPMTAEGAAVFWDSIARLSIAVNVDRAIPDNDGLLWRAIYFSAAETADAIGQFARTVTAEVTEEGLEILWGILRRLLVHPVGIAALGGSAWLFRRELGVGITKAKALIGAGS